MAVTGGGGFVVHHGHLDPLGVSSDTQTDQGDLDDGQQELETQRAANGEEMITNILQVLSNQTCPEGETYPGILFIRTNVLIIRAAMFRHFGSRCRPRTFQSAAQSINKNRVHTDSTQLNYV